MELTGLLKSRGLFTRLRLGRWSWADGTDGAAQVEGSFYSTEALAVELVLMGLTVLHLKSIFREDADKMEAKRHIRRRSRCFSNGSTGAR
jgi:hypothetical protein